MDVASGWEFERDSGRYRNLSLWLDQVAESDPLALRRRLDGERRCDVVIVGAGYTGLWAAYYLATRAPHLDVCVIEAEIAGFGASGRNGGWCSGEFSMRPSHFAPGEVVRQYRAVWESIDEVGRVSAAEGIDCEFRKGGSINLATSEPQVHRLHEEIRWYRTLGLGEDDYRWLEAQELSRHVRSAPALGGLVTPHCAVLQPAALARGLASTVERRGVELYEGTRAISMEPGVVETDRGRVYGRWILDCVEAFASQMPGRRRERVPIYSLMIATEPLDDSLWEAIGLDDRQTFSDARHNVIYGQRTADGRIAFGGRGAPYHFGSAMSERYERDDRTHEAIMRVLHWLFPETAGARITHTWGGAVAIPRDFAASVQWNRETGMARAGGYVGAGVSTSNLAGRTLADLVLDERTERTTLPWVEHRSPRWEPEPLRWLGVNLGRRLAQAADDREFETSRGSRVAGPIVERLTGH